jgi:hypothetical protein
MISISLTGFERSQFQYVIPVQGSLKTLELVDNILKKIKINEIKDNNAIEDIDFNEDEINFLIQSIKYLDQNNKLTYSSLTLVKKVLNSFN